MFGIWRMNWLIIVPTQGQRSTMRNIVGNG